MMRFVFILLFASISNYCQAQVSIDDLYGDWYACARIDSLEEVKVQTFTKKELTNEECTADHCVVSRWQFKADEKDQLYFLNNAMDGCKNDAVGTSNIALSEPWCLDIDSAKLIISEGGRNYSFKIIRLTKNQLSIEADK